MYDSNDVAAILTAARRDNALSQRQLALLVSAPLSVIMDLELGNLHNITTEQFLSALHQVGLNIKILPVPGPRPTYDDLVANRFEKQRAELFASWLNAEPGP
ncbi:putative XRE-type DNA-binding protein [Devosia subaequoris]|uniref:Putative XRE-type DNA-binding protein n=1 Tax=Devosia subaequoris TaxID=395930 RepID=A0A7W6IIV3_9HYPH|nr:hypothetical protein [Devosia subaequoris]MBB4050389.1 putative XRE-type DNA-binding protein [Devosia subaequoris]MCP1211589.1 hypothetical protein [Devosia subaequoris]